MMNETTVEESRITFDAHENQHTLTTNYSDQGMSHEMEERMYEVSEEAEEINLPLTDRDMGNSATESVINKKEEPKLTADKSHVCGFARVRSMDGDTFFTSQSA
jgi:hypothetical protein